MTIRRTSFHFGDSVYADFKVTVCYSSQLALSPEKVHRYIHAEMRARRSMSVSVEPLSDVKRSHKFLVTFPAASVEAMKATLDTMDELFEKLEQNIADAIQSNYYLSFIKEDDNA